MHHPHGTSQSFHHEAIMTAAYPIIISHSVDAIVDPVLFPLAPRNDKRDELNAHLRFIFGLATLDWQYIDHPPAQVERAASSGHPSASEVAWPLRPGFNGEDRLLNGISRSHSLCQSMG